MLHINPKQKTIDKKYGLKNKAFAVKLMVTALKGCHNINKIVLVNTLIIIDLLPLSLVLFGINIPRKNISSKREGNIKSERGNIKNPGESNNPTLNKFPFSPTIKENKANSMIK